MAVTLPVLLLTVALPKPSLIWDPTSGMEAGIQLRCSTPWPLKGGWFTLHRDGALGPVAEKRAPVRGSEVLFLLPTVSPGERYRCGYWNRGKAGRRVESPLSDPANITSGPDRYPKPSIAVRPCAEVLAGQSWTIQCWAPYVGMSFVLYRAREFRTERAPRGDPPTAEFHLTNASAADVGRYTCYYHTTSEPFIWSNASDPLELRVTEATLPQPSISITPSWGVSLGGAATIRCQAQLQNITFLLYKDGGYQRRAAPRGQVASFPVASARWEDAGSYSCSYETSRKPVATSHPSDSVRLVVTDYSQSNIIRLALAAGVLLVLALILAEAAQSWRRDRL
ncbi:T-cell-interacting, activating receptor on myeloid cells protein 1-like [Carettochelys insculpta]|uniref:T-cell-interacting, activating receptor on myeloid cells protein 1-like n=1 Tax=Carettochelys insculpta TaxID=44489 RepID=UPI003EC0498E